MDYERVERVLWLILGLNIIVALAKGVFGILSGSVSMMADAIHSTFDSVSNIVGIGASRIAAQPPDRGHPYGHGRFETLGAMVIGIMLMFSAYWIITEGAGRLAGGIAPVISLLTVAVMCGTVVINIFVAWYERKIGQELDSEFLIADSEHTRSDIFVSISVIAGFAVSSLGFPQADPIIAFVIGALIAKMGFGILRDASAVLTDSAVVDCRELVGDVVVSVHGVRGFHEFRCRGKPGELFTDIHILVDPAISVQEGHGIAEDVRSQILNSVEGIKDVVIHVEPDTEEERINDNQED